MRKKASISFTRDDLLNSNIYEASINSATMYEIMASTSSIIKDGSTLTPSSVIFYAYTKVGTGNYSAYNGWFKIQESIDGTNWTNKYSSASAESYKSYTPTATSKFVKCILYTNSSLTNEGAIISIGIIENGQQGSSVTIDSIKYAVNQNGSVQPDDSAFNTTMPTTSKGDWLWIKTTYSNWNVAISKSYIGTDGQDGKSIYVKSSSKVDGVTTIVLSDGTTDSTLTIADGEDGDEGEPGIDGSNSYVHFAWANSADGTEDFSTSASSGKSYMGVYTDENSPDSQTPSDYSWSLIKGSDGGNTAIVYLYQRSSTPSVIDWRNTLTYNFSNRALSSTPSGWYQKLSDVPSGTNPIYITTAVAYSNTGSDNILYSDWASPIKFVEDGADGTPGTDGTDGKNSAVVYLYQRSSTAPAVPSSNLTYTFSTGTVSGSGMGSWVQSIPSGTDPIYITSALAISTNLTYVIPGGVTPNGGWSQVRILAENGQDGKTPYIQNDYWYIDGSSTGIKALGENGSSIVWKGESSSAPANPELNWCYRNTSNNKVYIYNGSNWVIMTQDGSNGLDGYNQATLNLYRRTSSTLSSSDVPTSTKYNFSTKQITGSIGDWSRDIPSGTDQCWVTSAVAVSRATESDTLSWSEPVVFVKDGATGDPGYNQATVYLYKRATSVSKPTTAVRYTFSSGSISINGSTVTEVDGWSRNIPTGQNNSNPCWVTTASAIGDSEYVDLATGNWSSPVKLVENGTNATQYYTFVRYSANANGSNYVTTPSSSTPYIGVYVGTSSSPPAYNATGWTWSRYLGTSVTVTSIKYAVTSDETQPSTFTEDEPPEVPEGSWLWSKTTLSDGNEIISKTKSGTSGRDGIDGNDGLNQATINLYQRFAPTSSTSTPAKPSTTIRYRFSDGKLSSDNGTTWVDSIGNWTKSIPSVDSTKTDEYCWVISASAISDQSYDDIGTTEWVGPNKLSENGLNQAVVRLYKRAATQPSGTSAKPSTNYTYTFASGELTPVSSSQTNGWLTSIPASDDNPCWIISASAINKATTDTIGISDWGSPIKFVEDGVSISGVTNYYLATDQSSGITTSSSGWTTTIQSMTEVNQYLWNYEVTTSNKGTTLNTTTPCIIGRYGVDGNPGSPGKGITGITEYYLASSQASGITTSSSGWTTAVQTTDAVNKYLWNYEVISYTTGNPYTSTPRIIGTHGENGKMLWGACDTASGDSPKRVTCSEATSLYTGLTITIKFTQPSTSTSFKLAVGSLSAKDVYVNGEIVSSTNRLCWVENAVMTFTYDGTGWVLQDQPAIYSTTSDASSYSGPKQVYINGFVMRKGTTVLCRFMNAHTGTAQASLSIKSTSESTTSISGFYILSEGKNIVNSAYNTWSAGQTVQLVFNGSAWDATIVQDTKVLITVNSINYQNNSAELLASLYINGNKVTPTGITYKWTKDNSTTSIGTSATLTLPANSDLNAVYNCEINWLIEEIN